MEPHGQSLGDPHSGFGGGDIPPTRRLGFHRVAHGRRPWRNGGIAVGWVLASLSAALPAAAAVDHTAWDALLKRYVSEAGLVDYAAWRADRAGIDAYVASLSKADVTLGSQAEQLAFWINAYNACVIEGVLDRPGTASVKNVPGFFNTIRYPVAGASLTLNEIESRGRALGDWRIHVAVVCASSSCPFLRAEAYAPDRLNEQLADQLRRFLADPKRGLRVEGQTLWVSKMFKWYDEDFVPTGHLTAQTLVPVLAAYLSPEQAQAAGQAGLAVKFMDYDWSLNEIGRREP